MSKLKAYDMVVHRTTPTLTSSTVLQQPMFDHRCTLYTNRLTHSIDQLDSYYTNQLIRLIDQLDSLCMFVLCFVVPLNKDSTSFQLRNLPINKALY